MHQTPLTRDRRLVARRRRRGAAAREGLLRRCDLPVKLLQDVDELVHHLLLDRAARLDAAEVGEQLEGALGAAQLAEGGVDELALRGGCVCVQLCDYSTEVPK